MFLENTGKIRDLILSIKHGDAFGHVGIMRYPLLSVMINQMPVLNKLVLILADTNRATHESNLRFVFNHGGLNIHSESIHSIDAIDYNEDAFSRIACPNLTDLKLHVGGHQIPDILGNPQLINLDLKYTSLSEIDSLYDDVVEVIQKCHLLRTVNIAVHHHSSVDHLVDRLQSTKKRFEKLDHAVLRRRKCSVTEEITTYKCSIYLLRLHVNSGDGF